MTFDVDCVLKCYQKRNTTEGLKVWSQVGQISRTRGISRSLTWGSAFGAADGFNPWVMMVLMIPDFFFVGFSAVFFLSMLKN